MKTNPMPGSEIEVFSKIWQRNLRMNSRDHAADIEKFGSGLEERLLVGIEGEPFVTEEPADIEEISGNASKIENAEWRSSIEPKILGVLDVDADPPGSVLVSIDPSRIGPVGIRLTQPG